MFGSIGQMNADYSTIFPYAVAALAVFIIYRRFRRLFGRQRLAPGRMKLRVAILAVLGCALLPQALRSGEFLAAQFLGAASGVMLGIWGSRRTRFLTVGGQLHYVPHTLTGIAVSLLLIGRLAYRMVILYEAGRAAGDPARTTGFDTPSVMSSPLTSGLIFAVIGYYVCYYGLILHRSARIQPQDLEVISKQPAASP